jgi:hypothetical protein
MGCDIISIVSYFKADNAVTLLFKMWEAADSAGLGFENN